jgi:hypothetical protein
MINIFIIWGLILLFILQPGVAHDGAEAGARLFVHALLPYLLPYIILTQWLLKMPATAGKVVAPWKKFVKAYVLGSFGGFPVGAVTVSEMTKNEELTRKQAGLLLASCHAPGPMFVIGFVGIELFGDINTGWKLLIAIHIANIIFFFMTLLFIKNDHELKGKIEPPVTKRSTMPLLDSLKDSSEIIILVATTVIFFSSLGIVLSSVIASTFSVDTGIAQTVTLSIFEMTSGVQSATNHFSGLSIYPLLIAAIISMNGLSIHIQVAVIAKSAKVSMRPYLIGRMWCIVTVPILLFFLL